MTTPEDARIIGKYDNEVPPQVLETLRRRGESLKGDPHMCSLPDCPISYGLCHCGCGTPTPIAARSDTHAGLVKGQPRRFFQRHKQNPPVSTSLVAGRFWGRVNKHGSIPTHRPELGPCYVWTGHLDKGGYGTIRIAGKKVRAHRIGWELENGPLPEKSLACHHCDNPACVRAGHIYPGTHAENAQDRVIRGRCPIVDRRGEKGGRAKLTAVQVAEIRDIFQKGGTPKTVLALAYGVSPTNIYCIVTGKSWAS